LIRLVDQAGPRSGGSGVSQKWSSGEEASGAGLSGYRTSNLLEGRLPIRWRGLGNRGGPAGAQAFREDSGSRSEEVIFNTTAVKMPDVSSESHAGPWRGFAPVGPSDFATDSGSFDRAVAATQEKAWTMDTAMQGIRRGEASFMNGKIKRNDSLKQEMSHRCSRISNFLTDLD
jgi:hypothetical protein